MNEVMSQFQFKSDPTSIGEALEHLVAQCKSIQREDDEAIADAIYVSAVTFDVDQSVLNEAWGALSPQQFAA